MLWEEQLDRILAQNPYSAAIALAEEMHRFSTAVSAYQRMLNAMLDNEQLPGPEAESAVAVQFYQSTCNDLDLLVQEASEIFTLFKDSKAESAKLLNNKYPHKLSAYAGGVSSLSSIIDYIAGMTADTKLEQQSKDVSRISAAAARLGV